MQNRNSKEYKAKVQATSDLLTKLCKEVVDKNARVIQTQKGQKLLAKFGIKAF